MFDAAGRVDLRQMTSPEDLDALTPEQCVAVAAEIRSFLVERVSKTGGHLGPNLGVVELTMALHRVFRSPLDAILWDTGHQAYVHKIVTGRSGDFETLRQSGGLSGYPSRSESVHDVIENSHASTALSYADGIAKAWERQGVLGKRHVVAVIGDGALTGGMAWEALNNIAGSDRQIIIVVNDNERSYAPTIGGLATHLATLRTTRGYEKFLSWGKRVLRRTPVIGATVYETLHGVKKGVKDIVAPQGMFEDLGLKYVGPVDGHDVVALERALNRAKLYRGPVIVHALTEKGRGYAPAENDEADRFHGVGVIDPDTGQPIASSGPTWTRAFSDELVRIGRERHDVVAITAAMLAPTGLDAFAKEFPERTYDVGIAEQHAVTSAAGMAFAGMHPVVALYSTFLNRAFDQVLMDCALHRAGVTFVLDRAGVTGEDGASHNGMWDLAMLRIVPGLRLCAPRDEITLREGLRRSVDVEDGPSVIRFSKGALPDAIPAVERLGSVHVLRAEEHPDIAIVAIGAMASVGLDVAARLGDQGLRVRVVDPCWVLPIEDDLLHAVGDAELVVTIEDGLRDEGVGAALGGALAIAGYSIPILNFGLPKEFLQHAKRAEILASVGLTGQEICRTVVETAVRLGVGEKIQEPSTESDSATS